MRAERIWEGAPVPDHSRFDAIVVGSGAAGGVAATRLCDAGLKVLVLEAGLSATRPLNPQTRSLTAVARFLEKVEAERKLPPRLARYGELAFRLLGRGRQPVQSRCFAWALAPDLLIDDRDHPYATEEESRFFWFRSRRPGGRMMIPGHGRQYYRLTGMGLEGSDPAQARWPFRLEDIEDWYLWVEERLQLKGGAQTGQGPHHSALAEVLTPTGSETAIIEAIRSRWPQARPAIGTYAAPVPWLERAAASGQLTCQDGAVVRRVLKDEAGAAKGVEWIDSRSGNVRTSLAPIVFLCASAIESTRILLLSRPEGANADRNAGTGTGSPALGRNLMDHAVMSGSGIWPVAGDVRPEQSEPGRCIHVPPNAQHGAMSLQIHVHPRGSGARVDIVCFAEMLPDDWNRVTLSPARRDRHGIPIPVIRFRHSEQQREIARHQAELIRQLATDLGLANFSVNTALSPGGTSVHECGTARMGTDPATSVVDTNNECWDVPGLYVTDGACFPRQHVSNPTLTIMMLSARAAAHAAARVSSGGAR
jgi:choline dehydrogenase-like flavoprotein